MIMRGGVTRRGRNSWRISWWDRTADGSRKRFFETVCTHSKEEAQRILAIRIKDVPGAQMATVESVLAKQMQEMEIRVTANVVAALDARFAKLRRAVPEIVKEEHVYVVWRLGGKCPCCRDVTIVDPVTRKRLENSEIDHNHGPDKSDAQHTWLICRDCNRRFMRKDVARAGGEFEARFKAYQAARERFRFASLLWSEDGYVPEEGR